MRNDSTSNNALLDLDYHEIFYVTDVQQIGNYDPTYHPMDQYVQNSINENPLHRKFITYEMNKGAKTFGELFGIKINEESQDKLKANSIYHELYIAEGGSHSAYIFLMPHFMMALKQMEVFLLKNL